MRPPRTRENFRDRREEPLRFIVDFPQRTRRCSLCEGILAPNRPHLLVEISRMQRNLCIPCFKRTCDELFGPEFLKNTAYFQQIYGGPRDEAQQDYQGKDWRKVK